MNAPWSKAEPLLVAGNRGGDGSRDGTLRAQPSGATRIRTAMRWKAESFPDSGAEYEAFLLERRFHRCVGPIKVRVESFRVGNGCGSTLKRFQPQS